MQYICLLVELNGRGFETYCIWLKTDSNEKDLERIASTYNSKGFGAKVVDYEEE